MTAVRADVEVLLEAPAVEDLPAALALVPHVSRQVPFLRDQLLLWLLEPGHSSPFDSCVRGRGPVGPRKHRVEVEYGRSDLRMRPENGRPAPRSGLRRDPLNHTEARVQEQEKTAPVADQRKGKAGDGHQTDGHSKINDQVGEQHREDAERDGTPEII